MPASEREAPRGARWLLPLLAVYPLAAAALLMLLEPLGLPGDGGSTGLLAQLTLSLLMLALLTLLPAVEPDAGMQRAGWRFRAEAVLLALALQLGFTGLSEWLPPLPGAFSLPEDCGGWKLPLLALMLCVLTPWVEERLFRGRLLPLMGQWLSPLPASVLAALIFAALHDSPQGFLAQFAFGLALNSLARRSGSLGPGFLCHAVFNLLALLMLLWGRNPGPLPPAAFAPLILPALLWLWRQRPAGESLSRPRKPFFTAWTCVILLMHGALMLAQLLPAAQ